MLFGIEQLDSRAESLYKKIYLFIVCYKTFVKTNVLSNRQDVAELGNIHCRLCSAAFVLLVFIFTLDHKKYMFLFSFGLTCKIILRNSCYCKSLLPPRSPWMERKTRVYGMRLKASFDCCWGMSPRKVIQRLRGEGWAATQTLTGVLLLCSAQLQHFNWI